MKKLIKIIRKFAKLFGLLIIKDRPSNSNEKQLSNVLNLLNIDTILDIGANEGQFGKNIRDNSYKGKIISFEPLTSARKKLISLANQDNEWEVYKQCALGNQNGQIKINISKNSVSSSILPMTKEHSIAEQESIYVDSENVPIIKLDSVDVSLIDLSSNLFIKIDTQGYEKEILEGADLILNNAKGILCELSLVSLYEGQYLWKDIIEILDQKGFILWALQKGFTNPETGQTLQMDGIFIKKNEMNKIFKKIDEKYYK